MNYDTIRIIIGDMSYVHTPNFVARTYDVYNKNYILLFKPTLATPFSSMYKLHTLITETRCKCYVLPLLHKKCVCRTHVTVAT